MVQKNQQSKKGLPRRASRRSELAVKRAAQHNRAARRKSARIAAQAAREQANRNRQGLTPWQQAKAARYARRHKN